MKLIGIGYYYRVYDLGNGRVRKVVKGKLETALHILFFERLRMPSSLRAIRTVYASSDRIAQEYQQLKECADASLLGNPTFLNALEYEQDCAVPLKKLLKPASTDTAKKYLDKYVSHIHMCWEYGFSEKVFNFSLNNGMDKADNLILFDFNEITFDKEEARRRIASRRWEKAYSCRSLPGELQEYYLSAMAAAMTSENLDRLWASKLA